jgi:hypothetical protein
MGWKLIICLLCSVQVIFGQERNLKFKDYFNEFHISVNHGVPFYPAEKTFFGGGLGMNHVFRANRVVGARAGLEIDFLHFWSKGESPPEYDQTILNQHLYLTSLCIPINLQINFGGNLRFLFEMGGRLGFNLYSFYSGDVLHTKPNYETYFVHEKNNRGGPVGLAFAGVNSGLGVRIPCNEKFDFVVRPTLQLNIYDLDRLHFYGKVNLGIHLK